MSKSIKVYLAGPGSSFVGQRGETFQNKDQVAQYCSQIWNQVEFVKSESKDCDWIVHPSGVAPPAPKKGKTRSSQTYVVGFNDFENYLQDHAVRQQSSLLEKPSTYSTQQQLEAEMKHGGPDWNTKIAQKQAEVNQLQANWNKDPSPANWSRLNQAKTELEALKRAAAQQGKMMPGVTAQSSPEAESAEMGARRNPRRSTRMVISTEEKKKKKKSSTKKKKSTRGRPKKRTMSDVSVPMEEDSSDDNMNEDDGWENYSVTEEGENEVADATATAAAKKKKKKKRSSKGKKKTSKKSTKGKKKKKRSTKGKKKKTTRKSKSKSRK